MSTTFQVFPTDRTIPSFRALIEHSEAALAAFLFRRAELGVSPKIELRLLENRTNRDLPLDLDAPAVWPASAYAWFTVADVVGGTDAYFQHFDAQDHSIWSEELETPHYAPWTAEINSALQIGHFWTFRRSAGQPAIINIAYAVIAAELAKFCAGFLESCDSAWEYELLPQWPERFLDTYFDPSAAVSAEYLDWARRCLDALPDELRVIARPTGG
jgi:hypothetical protein